MEVKNNYLAHHGILNQKWGQRNGPPYPLKGGQYSPSEKQAIITSRKKSPHNIYNKKHFDEVLSKDSTTLSTLSYDSQRTSNVEMFYATWKKLDKHQYNALFNKKAPVVIKDDDGNEIGTTMALKWRIDNKLKSDMKVASEDSASSIFKALYTKDRDFYNFVTDKNRMRDYFVKNKYVFKGYREARDVLNKLDKNPDFKPTSSDLTKVYRMFNYTLPYDGAGDSRRAHDMNVQRAKFIKEVKNAGYGAVLDTNDAIYGGFKASSPIIVFDMDNIIPDKVIRTSTSSKYFSQVVTAARKTFGF